MIEPVIVARVARVAGGSGRIIPAAAGATGRGRKVWARSTAAGLGPFHMPFQHIQGAVPVEMQVPENRFGRETACPQDERCPPARALQAETERGVAVRVVRQSRQRAPVRVGKPLRWNKFQYLPGVLERRVVEAADRERAAWHPGSFDLYAEIVPAHPCPHGIDPGQDFPGIGDACTDKHALFERPGHDAALSERGGQRMMPVWPSE